ncbi:MAG TPA: 4Fe-4S double cluster binding domain-containing protein [Syntrophomonadaceae bacterium]|nr:4Fe-4S double cluster binding domain-containing protein [Syntrophomonadaceae bacterium]
MLIKRGEKMDLQEFARVKRLSVLASVSIARLRESPDFPRELIPRFCHSIILLARELPSQVFEVESWLKTFYLSQFMKEMDLLSYNLSQLLLEEGHFSMPVPTFFPVRFEKGRLQGMLSLKHCAVQAGLGSLGLNTLLISPQFGNRLCLSAVFSQKKEETTPALSPPLCTTCKKCLDICPSGAISEHGVDFLKCLNVRRNLPGPLKGIISLKVRRKANGGQLESLLNTIAWNAEMVCSLCMTVCPHF